jgi:hypothetical protein
METIWMWNTMHAGSRLAAVWIIVVVLYSNSQSLGLGLDKGGYGDFGMRMDFGV